MYLRYYIQLDAYHTLLQFWHQVPFSLPRQPHPQSRIVRVFSVIERLAIDSNSETTSRPRQKHRVREMFSHSHIDKRFFCSLYQESQTHTQNRPSISRKM